jgi:hypothetical protein
MGFNVLQTFISNRICGPSCHSTIIPIENQLYDLKYQYDNLADDIMKQSISTRIVALNSQHKGNTILASLLTTLFYERNLSPLLVHGDGSCLFHATNAAHQAINNNTDIIPSRDLRLAACTLARDFLLSNTTLCTEQNLLELENSLDDSEDVFNELIFLSLATIRNGKIIILNESGNIVTYAPHTDMNRILLQGKDHPLPPQESIVLLHRSSTRPLHYDATQPATRVSRSSSIVAPNQFPNTPKLISTRNDTQDNSELAELQQITELNEEPIIPPKSRLSHQDSPLDNSMIPDDSPLKSPPLNEEIALDKSSNINEEISYLRPPSPTCSSTDEYSDSESDTDKSNMEYEQPPSDCWETMDPAQRHAWLRDHQLPNKDPCKLELTNTQDLTRRQIRKLKRLKQPETFHNQSSSSEPNQLTSLPEPQTFDPALTINPNQLSEPTLPPPRKRNLLNHQYDLDGTKKPRPEYTPDIYATNEDPLPQSSMVQLLLTHHKQKMIPRNDSKMINGNNWTNNTFLTMTRKKQKNSESHTNPIHSQ